MTTDRAMSVPPSETRSREDYAAVRGTTFSGPPMPTTSQTSFCPSTRGPRSEAPNAPGASIYSTASSRPEPPKRTRRQTTLPTLRTRNDNSPTNEFHQSRPASNDEGYPRKRRLLHDRAWPWLAELPTTQGVGPQRTSGSVCEPRTSAFRSRRSILMYSRGDHVWAAQRARTTAP